MQSGLWDVQNPYTLFRRSKQGMNRHHTLPMGTNHFIIIHITTKGNKTSRRAFRVKKESKRSALFGFFCPDFSPIF